MATQSALALVEALKGSDVFQSQLSALDSMPLASTDPQLAIDLKWLIDQLPALLPMVITLLTGGGFAPALIPIIIKIVAEMFGVSESEARQMVTA